jgi:hypothetical protein
MAIIFDLFENSVKDGIVASKLHVKRWGDYPLKSGSDTQKMYRSPGGCDTALNDELYENLSNGYAVHLDSIGYFI